MRNERRHRQSLPNRLEGVCATLFSSLPRAVMRREIKVRLASAESQVVVAGRERLFICFITGRAKTVSVASAPPCCPPLLFFSFFSRISDNCVPRVETMQRGPNICFPFQTTTLDNCWRTISYRNAARIFTIPAASFPASDKKRDGRNNLITRRLV